MSLLQAEKISFTYSSRTDFALRDISLALAPGEIVTLIGPNASGKSTLLRVLLGQHRSTGQITWHDRPLRRWPRRQFGRLVAYLPQTPTFDDAQSVADVLRLGRVPYWSAFGIESEKDATIVRDVAEKLSLTPFLSRPISELSGGQRQRVFLARCLTQQPQAMLLDEPNTFLDLRHQVEILRLLQSIAREQNVAVLMASHDLTLAAAVADRMILMHQGQLVATGAPADVLTEPQLTQVYGVPIHCIPGPRPIVYPEI